MSKIGFFGSLNRDEDAIVVVVVVVVVVVIVAARFQYRRLITSRHR